MSGGWGEDGWGVGPWGGGDDSGDSVVAEALRENLVRIVFPMELMVTGLFDRTDSLSLSHYSMSTPTGTGLDDIAARPVNIILVEKVPENAAAIDLYVDRPFSHYPTIYIVQCINMYDSSGAQFLDEYNVSFFGVQATFNKPVAATYEVGGTRDLANPSGKEALFDPLPEITDENLGTYPVGDDGDYGHDEGPENLRKRVLRRCIVVAGGFVWLPKYGAGIATEGKKLNNAARRERIRANLEDQITQEPDVRAVRITIRHLPSTPGIIWFIIKVLSTSRKAYKFDVPFAVV